MKTRSGFVSNSSSSSFVCDITGRSESGWDMCLSEADMYECENGHTICRDEVLYNEDIHKKIVAELTECGSLEEDCDLNNFEDLSDFHEIDNFEYQLPECCCPICNFLVYSESDIVSYLFKKYSVSKEDAFAEVKAINKRRRKLYDTEYVSYVCKVKGTTVDSEFDEIKTNFGVYSKFSKYLNS